MEARIEIENGRQRRKSWLREHRYAYAMGYLLIFLAMFFITERMVEPEYMISCRIDSWIPFCEPFILLYFLWFLLLPASWIYTLSTSKEDFQELFLIMFGGMTISIGLYWLFPNGLDLRPGQVSGGVFGQMVSWLHSIDTPGNVCPSIHVSSSTAVALTAYHSRFLRDKRKIRWVVYLAVGGICVSTLFLKQHSVIDVVCGFLLTLVLAWAVYTLPWQRWMKGTWMEFFL